MFYFSKDHEWLREEDGRVLLGITEYAQKALGDIVYADGEPVGKTVCEGDTVAVVESVKAASDVYAPVAGRIDAVNDKVVQSPELINESPYESWLVALTDVPPQAFSRLMDEDAYKEFCKE